MALMHEAARYFAEEYNCRCEAYEDYASGRIVLRAYGKEDDNGCSYSLDRFTVERYASDSTQQEKIYLDVLKVMGSKLEEARIAKSLDAKTGRRVTKMEPFIPAWYKDATLTYDYKDGSTKPTLTNVENNTDKRKKLKNYGRY
jgi:hypothetical protein